LQSTWQIKDLVDLEYFLNQESGASSSNECPDDLSSERRLYLSYEKSHQPPFSRKNLIKFWLEEKQNSEKTATDGPIPLPGDGYNETISLLRSLIVLLSFISGAALAWSALSYSGTTPINIFTCIWILIVPQFFLIAVLGISALFSFLGFTSSFKGLYPLMVFFFRQLSKWLNKRAKHAGKNSMSADQRMRLFAMAGFIGRQKTLYGSVFFWPVFILAQTFGIFFNLGLLGASLLKLSITDLAFGWQSTLLPDPAIVYRMVDVFARPWSWFSTAHPTLTQIEGSRMILKDGMMHLTTPDLVSWWPFLCFSILCYGVLPRLLLLVLGLWRQNRALRRVNFSTGGCDRLIQRMQFPKVTSAGREYSAAGETAAKSVQTKKESILSAVKPAIAENPAIVFISEDIDALFSDEALNERISNVLGLKVVTRIRAEIDPAADMELLEAGISRNNISLSDLRIVILAEAWQPPIRETLTWLTHLRKAVNKDTGIIIALVGKPLKNMIFTSPDNTDRVIWEKTVNSIADPFMRIESIGGG